MRKLYTRSPIFVQSSTGTSAELSIKIWTGSVATPPITDTYTLNKTHNSNGKATFEVSDLLSDYIEHSFTGTYESSPVYVKFTVDETGGGEDEGVVLLAVDGYTEGDYVQYCVLSSQEYNFKDDEVMMTLGTLATPEDTTTVVPIEGASTVIFFKDDVQKFVYTSNAATYSTQEIEYATSAGHSASTFYARVILDGGTVIDEHCSDEIMEFVTELDVDTIYIVKEDGNAEVINVEQLPCNKYENLKLTFVNKFGALQDIHFSAKNSKSYKFEGEEYKSLNFDYDNLSNNYNQHSTTSFNKNGETIHKLNTDFLPEAYSEYFKQLLMSERVWLEHKGTVVPVNVSKSSLEHKTHVNNGLVRFEITVKESHNIATNVR